MRHAQVWVKVNVPVDEGIADLVALLNSVEGMMTLDSCQGDQGGPGAYVLLEYGSNWRELGNFLFDRLGPLAVEASDDLTLTLETFGDRVVGKLAFRAEATRGIVSALRRLLQQRP